MINTNDFPYTSNDAQMITTLANTPAQDEERKSVLDDAVNLNGSEQAVNERRTVIESCEGRFKL
jgi:hypothetical protein